MGASKKKDYPNEELLERYENLIAEFPKVERKGKTMPYTSVNGHMFSFLDKEGRLSLRLKENMRNELIEKYKAELSVQHGRIMKEYLIIPKILLGNFKDLKGYFKASYDYTCSLKPK